MGGTTGGRPDKRIVLIVDADPSVRNWLSRSLERLGYGVLTAEDQHGAEAILKTGRVDAAIIDVNLRHHSALDLVAVIRGSAKLARMPLVMLTILTHMSEDLEQAIARHRAFVFYKPASIIEIHATLQRELSALP